MNHNDIHDAVTAGLLYLERVRVDLIRTIELAQLELRAFEREHGAGRLEAAARALRAACNAEYAVTSDAVATGDLMEQFRQQHMGDDEDCGVSGCRICRALVGLLGGGPRWRRWLS